APPPAPPAAEGEGTSTVMFSAQSFAAMKQQAAAPARPAPAPPPRPAAPAARPVSPDDQKAHDDAKRFARLVVSEIKL
ncbi:MAG TPA: dihydrolipoamide succinyltransferase, partial [Vicinamibacteria bacterium]|nr:dihydrolipoamide succinyltransferase [Vicinamibacteria bacterium]